jgi:c-di-GMP-binding flagellar brake protein YcgR
MNTIQSGASPGVRRWHRYNVDVRLKVSVPGKVNATPVFGRARNLSQGGMGAYIPCEVPLGGTILIDVTFPYTSKEIRVTAVVRNVDGFRYGLEFQRLSDDIRAMIAKSCDAWQSEHRLG